jgi:AraC-like DNA-binding protein
MPLPTGTVSAMFVRALLQGAEVAGVTREALIDAAGIEPARMTDPAGRFELSELVQVCECALELSGDPALGLHVMERANHASFALVAHMTVHAPTLRAAIGLFGRFGPLIADGGHLVLRETKDWATVECVFPRCGGRAGRMLAEQAVVGLMRFIRGFSNESAPRTASFEHSEPSYSAEYTRIFDGVARFDQPFNGLEFAQRFLDRDHLHTDPALYALLCAEATRSLRRLAKATGIVEKLRQYLCYQPLENLPDMSAAARELGMSTRSLRRHLADESASYAALLDDVRATAAERLLRDPKRTLKNVTVSLGFSDPAAFHRAFRRWRGTSPGRYRAAFE